MPELTNPVRILRKIKGCVIGPGVEAGQMDINGNRYASCGLDGTQRVDATTYPGNPRLFDTFPGALTSDDKRKVIIGADFLVAIILMDDYGQLPSPEKVDLKKIAGEVDGQLVPSNT